MVTNGICRQSSLPADFGGNEIAVFGAFGSARWNSELATELLFVDRRQAPAVARQCPKNAEHAILGTVDYFYDAAGVPDRLIFITGFFDAQQNAVPYTGDLAGPRTTWNHDPDLGWSAVRLLVPLGRQRDQLAVAITFERLGENRRRKVTRPMQLLTATLDLSFIGEVAQHMLERRAIGI